MQLSARGAQKRRNESKKLQMYSKQWMPGDVMRVLYPIYWTSETVPTEHGDEVIKTPDIAVGAVWGHNVSDIKKLGLRTAFIPSTTDFDENGVPIGQPDITYQFSQIAPVFVNGAKTLEEAAIQNKKFPDEATRREALRTLEHKYDTKANKDAIKPIIGRAQYYISTEVLSIKMANGQPQLNTIMVTSCPLANKTINWLYAIMDDPKYAPQEGDEFLEVEWKYPAGNDKGESGKTAIPEGLTPEYRLSAQFPSAWKTIMGQKEMVIRDSESIVRRATRTIDPEKVRQALTRYAFMESEYLDVADDDDAATLLKHTDLIESLGIIRAMSNDELIDKLQTAIKEMTAQRPAESIETVPEPKLEDVENATPLAASQDINPDAPTVTDLLGGMQGLLNNVNNAGADTESTDDIDFAPAEMV